MIKTKCKQDIIASNKMFLIFFHLLFSYFTASLPEHPGARHIMSISLSNGQQICHTCKQWAHEYFFEDETCLSHDMTLLSLDNNNYYVYHCLGPTVLYYQVRQMKNHEPILNLEDNNDLKMMLNDNYTLPLRKYVK